MSIDQLAIGWNGVCLTGGSVEPLISVEALTAAVPQEFIERFRPLLPVGYESVVKAYRRAVEQLTVHDLTDHYTQGLQFFREEFEPHLKQRVSELTGGVWSLDDYEAYAAGSDADFMAHVVEGVVVNSPVTLYPGDWFGFQVGCSQPAKIRWSSDSAGSLACLCVPSVRNGHLSESMANFLEKADACLLNINLFPTLSTEERRAVAERLSEILPKSLISISFSRGFGMTASQLGVILVHRKHPLRHHFLKQWEWFTYFYNGIAAQAFLKIDLADLQAVDLQRREWVRHWLVDHQLPVVNSGSYYVKSFRIAGNLPAAWQPLTRDGLVRLCFKPPQT